MFGNVYNVALTAFLVFSGLLLILGGRRMLRNASQVALEIESRQARYWGGERNEAGYSIGSALGAGRLRRLPSSNMSSPAAFTCAVREAGNRENN